MYYTRFDGRKKSLPCPPSPIRSSSLFTKLLIIARVHLALATMRSACMVHPPLGIDRPVQSSPTPLSLSLSLSLPASRRDTILVHRPHYHPYPPIIFAVRSPLYQLPVRQILTNLFHDRSYDAKSIPSMPCRYRSTNSEGKFYLTDLSTDIDIYYL